MPKSVVVIALPSEARTLPGANGGESIARLYALAAVLEGMPVLDLTPSEALTDESVLSEARRTGTPVAGRDLKTGQTLLKSVLAPALLGRRLAIRSWYSCNILGNSDGANLDAGPGREAKQASKRKCLESLAIEFDMGTPLQSIDIDYYPPRGDSKEAWDRIELAGWFEYEMSIRVNFQCRDSILAAPLVLDASILLSAAQVSGRVGPQGWLAAFFKDPVEDEGRQMESHSYYDQLERLKAVAMSMVQD